LELMADAGLVATAARMHPFTSAQEVIDRSQSLAKRDCRLIVQHVYPRCALPAESMWLDPTLLSYLNNKANLAEIVPVQHRPKRSAQCACKAMRSVESFPLPFVMKVATDDSTGGGAAVAVCRTPADVAAARQQFVSYSGDLIVEECLTIV